MHASWIESFMCADDHQLVHVTGHRGAETDVQQQEKCDERRVFGARNLQQKRQGENADEHTDHDAQNYFYPVSLAAAKKIGDKNDKKTDGHRDIVDNVAVQNKPGETVISGGDGL